MQLLAVIAALLVVAFVQWFLPVFAVICGATVIVWVLRRMMKGDGADEA